MDKLDFIFNLQKKLQEETYGKDFSEMTLIEIKEYWLTNKLAEDDETLEMFKALGGEKDGIGNAVWKTWKNDHRLARLLTIKDLSIDDLELLYFEFIDKLHFVLNYAVSIGMTPELILKLYKEKNKVNIDRQEQNY